VTVPEIHSRGVFEEVTPMNETVEAERSSYARRPKALTLCLLVLLSLLVPEQSQAQSADKAARDLKKELSSGLLIKWGLTAGVGVMGLTRWGGLPVDVPTDGVASSEDAEALSWDVAQVGVDGGGRGFAVAVTPYVGVLPRRWFIKGDVTRRYCANKWLLGDAQQTADAYAYAKARVEAEKELEKSELDEKERARLEGVKDSKSNSGHDAKVKELTGWRPGAPGRCGAFVPGLYVGIPAKFKTSAFDGIEGLTTDEFDPLFSTGIIFAPTAAFSFMLGYTVSSVHTEGSYEGATLAGEDEPETFSYKRTRRTGHLSIGIGANFDLASFLIKR